jgi:hypothetical protein
MSKTKPMDFIASARAHAKEKEKKYDWVAAIEFHKKTVDNSLQHEDFLGAGEAAERVGYCFYRAAMQAKSRDEFEKKLKLAIGAYQRAQGFYETLQDPTKAGRELRSKAISTYLNYWLASSGAEKRKLLDECLELEDKSLTALLTSANMLEYCRTYNTLWSVFFLRGYLEWDGQALLRLINRGMEWGKKAISALSEADNPEEFVLASFTFATCLTFVASFPIGVFILELEEMDKNRLEAIAILEKAIILSEKLDDAFLTGVLHLWLAFNKDRVATSRSYCEKALALGEITGDNFLIGASLEMLSYDILWQGVGDSSRKWLMIDSAMECHEKALGHNSIIHFQTPIAGPINAPYGRAAYYCFRATIFETDPNERLELLQKAENAAIEALKLARNSDMPATIGGALHTLSKILMERARLNSDPAQKRIRLKKSMELRKELIKTYSERLSLFNYFDLGVHWSFLAETIAKLAELTSNPDERKQLLQEAVAYEERSLELFGKLVPYYENIGNFDYLPVLGEILDRCATILVNLHALTKQSENLRRAIEILTMALTSAKKQEIITFQGELYWRIAKAQDVLGEHLEAAESFERASESYAKAAKRFPQLKDFYEGYAAYMQAWSEIERAKVAHLEEKYGQAKRHYEKAAFLHKSTTQWSCYGSNYLAWAQLEVAEKLSRSEKPEEAKKNFLKTVELFEKAGKSILPKLETLLTKEEKELANALLNASEKRREYCMGRIALEEAKLQERKGDFLQSSKKFGLAAKIFERMTEGEEERRRKQLLSLSYLCQAWQKMMLAEATMSPEAYEEAAVLFKQAREHSLNQKASLLALANSQFCKALASGTEFEITRNIDAYSNAKKYMEAAENCYLKAGYGPAAEYAKATLTLLDAYMYTTKAETETQPTDKAKYYNMAERTLKTSVDSYLRAKYPEKSAEVKRLLENVVEKRKLTVSMITVLSEPTVTATTKSFSAPTPTHEQAVGFERFEHAELEGNLAIPGEATVEEQIEVKLDIVNVGREPGLLLRIQGLIPPSFKVVSSSPQLKIEGDLIDMKGKRIESLKVDSMRLSLQTIKTGIFDLKPQIVYVDEVGSFKHCFPKPATLTVYPKLELEFRTNTAQRVFEYLVKSFVEDYMKRKLVLQESGWRTYVQIMKNAKISSRKIYGNKGIPGLAISELQRRGLIETRIFLGERGRGGKIIKTRICYEREVVKRLVDHKVAKNE